MRGRRIEDSDVLGGIKKRLLIPMFLMVKAADEWKYWGLTRYLFILLYFNSQR